MSNDIKLPVHNWKNFGNSYYREEVSALSQKLAPAIYNLEKDDQGRLHLKMISAGFDLPAKIYDNQLGFVNKVCKTWRNTKKNLGIILTGEKGSGKTVTAKQICRELGLPIIMVNNDFEGDFIDFAKKISEDVVYFFDEFEKTHNENYKVLSLFDGAETTTGCRSMFMLTTNSLYIHDALLNRPSRIRYLKEFGNLDRKTIDELLDDALMDKSLRNDAFTYISKLKLITIDIVLSVIQEINLHGEMPTDFNVKANSVKRLVEITKKAGKNTVAVEKMVAESRENMDDDDYNPGRDFHFADRYWGTVMEYNPIRKELIVNASENDGDGKRKKVIKTYRMDDDSWTNYFAQAF